MHNASADLDAIMAKHLADNTTPGTVTLSPHESTKRQDAVHQAHPHPAAGPHSQRGILLISGGGGGSEKGRVHCGAEGEGEAVIIQGHFVLSFIHWVILL